MVVTVTNAQRAWPVNAVRMARVARCAVQRQRLNARGQVTVTFISDGRMRALNKRFCSHDWATDVLSFRYDGEPIVGEILIAPGRARAYARRHDLRYTEELARYVVHGLLHWQGHEDATPAQQHRMRALEDRLLDRCHH